MGGVVRLFDPAIASETTKPRHVDGVGTIALSAGRQRSVLSQFARVRSRCAGVPRETKLIWIHVWHTPKRTSFIVRSNVSPIDRMPTRHELVQPSQEIGIVRIAHVHQKLEVMSLCIASHVGVYAPDIRSDPCTQSGDFQ